ncbi:cellulose biosynthesis cyclic di-GMP-binding regulatory protein BcsB [Curvibacter sp. HBC28]|uniref:Cyclic di-GMP-binding protein n=1 Tax=Curvibacter microcysteis TaxID=3026419 RepID=A0ABT5MLU2_9BURK|nr:cellulose biosynthesis cyclic di-GMP-binding regulatory protein BcsB [Curvibacter sp. HBC28]MDD0816195.1 cellulose biosynthesis cyclic di-GMP-binding regulatory protein BcsB [Curvibacter sp. HBC28]
MTQHHTALSQRPAHRVPLQPVILAIALMLAAPGLQTAQAATKAKASSSRIITETAAEAAGETPSQRNNSARTVSFSLKQLGALFPLQLRGIRGNSGVTFSIRADQVVTGAKLKINYAYSPALIPQLSHINVMVNEQVAATIPVPTEQAGQNLQREILIPPRLITEFNRLNLELIGHYTRDCEDPAHSSLWANVGNDSTLELTLTPVAQANDLALLPQPFFDRRDALPLNLPMVFAGAPNSASLEAAGALSSWFGALAGYRGARFPALVDQIPAQGNAIVLALGNQVPGGLNVAALQGPTVAMVPNPNDPNAKLLLVMGRDAKELKIAANAVAVGSPALSGPVATITNLSEIKPRKPYDAPNWLASDRPVKFGELALEDNLNVAGYSPDLIRVNFHLPPDLFGWRSKGIPVDLKYRYTPRPNTDKSTLNINANQQFLRSLPLLAINHEAPSAVDRLVNAVVPAGELIPAREQFHIPLFKLPAQTQLQFHYFHDMIKQGACKDVVLDNVRGTVEPDSTVDISGFSHFLAMPDLAAFSNTGFPFTRMADLSETAVVLPEKPSLNDYSSYLSLLGVFGRSTGYPATAVSVIGPKQVEALAGKDVVLIGSGNNQPLLTQWADASPVGIQAGSRRFKLSDFAYRVFSWWDPSQRDGAKPGRNQVAFTADSTDGVIAGFESPVTPGRSVVQLSSNNPEGMTQIIEALLDPDLVKEVQGSTSVVRGKQVDSLVAEQTYWVGRLDPLTWVQWYLSRSPLLLLALGIVAALLIGVLLYLSLRARAKARLKNKD